LALNLKSCGKIKKNDREMKFRIGALFSRIRNFKRKKLYDKISRTLSQDSLRNMSWRDFEFLVGEYFRRWQFSVEETKAGTDGGVDLIARKDREEYFIQCEHRGAGRVELKVVRDLPGVMVEDGATGGIVVTSGEFTKDVISFAKTNNIALLDGRELLRNINLQGIYESQPDRKKERILKRVKWLLAGLLVAAICFSALYPGKMIRKKFFHDDQEHQDIIGDQIKKPISQEESTDYKFTDDQVKRAMEEVLNSKKRRQSDTGTTDHK
jgi:HJR/Mrr/RecB family endonuclease